MDPVKRFQQAQYGSLARNQALTQLIVAMQMSGQIIDKAYWQGQGDYDEALQAAWGWVCHADWQAETLDALITLFNDWLNDFRE